MEFIAKGNAMIDTKRETLITVAEARRQFPQQPSTATVWRWMLKGVRDAVLESVHVGGRRFTSIEACHRFIEATSERDEKPKQRTKREQRQSLRQAKLILDQFGV